MAYDTGLTERVRDTLHRLGERRVREKNVFGGRGFLFGKKTFLVVMDDSLLIKAAPDEYGKAVRRRGVEPFAPDGGRSMTTWLVIAPDVVADDPELGEWVAAAIRGVRVAT